MSNRTRQIHEGNALNKDFIIMTIPLFMMGFFFYGPRVLLLALVAVITASLTDRFAAMLRGRRYDKTENSSITIALIFVLMLPASVRYRVVIAGVLMAVLVAKEAFGGYQSYPFNPSAVGLCVVAVSWPEEIFRYPAPTGWLMKQDLTFAQLQDIWSFKDVTLVPGPSSILRNGGLPKIEFWNLLLGNYGAPLGIGCSLVILSCAGYLLVKKRMSIYAPLFFLGTVALIAFLFPRYTEISWQTWPQDFMLRLQVVKFEGLTGGMVFASVFLISEPGTLPKTKISQCIYGFLLGVAAMMFRYFGTYELGISFAFLLVNALSGYFDRAVSRVGAKRKEAALS